MLRTAWLATVVLALLPTARAAEGPSAASDAARWVAQLKAKKTEDRVAAARELGRLAPAAAAAAVDPLATALSDRAVDVRVNAAWALGQIAGEDEPWRRSLPGETPTAPEPPREEGALSSPDFRAKAVPALLKALEDKENAVRTNSARALGRIGRQAVGAAAALSRALGDGTTDVRVNASWALGAVPADVATVPALARALADAETRVRFNALEALGGLAEAAAPAVPAIQKALQEEPPPPKDIVSRVMAERQDLRLSLRLNALRTLSRIGKAAAPAVPAVARFVADRSPEIRRTAIWALANIRAGCAPAVPALTEALKDPDLETRRQAAYALGRIGPDARGAVPALAAARDREDEDRSVRDAARAALRIIAGEVVPDPVSGGQAEEPPPEPRSPSWFWGGATATVQIVR